MLRCAALFLLVALPAHAQAPGPAGPKNLSITTGVLACILPEHQGSETSRTLVVPMIQVDYRNRIMIGPNSSGNGAGVTLRTVQTSRCAWDVDLSAEGPRQEKRVNALAGMGDHDVSLWAGAGVTFRARGLSAQVAGTYGLKRQCGWKGQTTLGYDRFFARRWLVGIQTTAQVLDARNALYEFGITAEQAQRRARLLATGDTRLRPGDDVVYVPGSGLTSIKAGLTANRILDSHWSVMAAVSTSALQGDARRSPLTKRTTNTATALGLMCRF